MKYNIITTVKTKLTLMLPNLYYNYFNIYFLWDWYRAGVPTRDI